MEQTLENGRATVVFAPDELTGFTAQRSICSGDTALGSNNRRLPI